MKKVVYSAIFNNYDSIKDPIVVNPDWEYILFTDDPNLRSDWWRIFVVDHTSIDLDSFDHLFPTARHVKIMTPFYYKWDVALWVDGSIALNQDPEFFLNKLGEGDFLFRPHPTRKNVYEEISAVARLRGDPEFMEHQKTFDYYNMPHDSGMYETGVYMVRNTQISSLFSKQWMDKTEEFGMRDQIALPYILHRISQKPSISTFTDEDYFTSVALYNHATPSKPKVHYITPYAPDFNLGGAYNEACDRIPDGDWIGIGDGDACFLNPRWGKQIQDTINKYPEGVLFGCLTNRLRGIEQLVGGKFSESSNILEHKKISDHLERNYYAFAEEAKNPIAGLLMVFPKWLWEKIKFKQGLIGIDTDFGLRAQQYGKTYIIKGIYMFHYYRLAEGANYTDHLVTHELPKKRVLDVEEIRDIGDVIKILQSMQISPTDEQFKKMSEDQKKFFKAK